MTHLSQTGTTFPTEKQADEWLRMIERSGLPEKFTAWLFPHGLLPRLMWLLTMDEVEDGIEK